MSEARRIPVFERIKSADVSANVQGRGSDNLCAGQEREECRAYRRPDNKRLEVQWSSTSKQEGLKGKVV